MHCWKSYHVDKRYQFYRLFIISSLITLLVFITLYVPMQTVASEQLKDNYFIVFLCMFILLYPVHKLFHVLPIVNHYQDFKLEIDFYFYILPIIDIKVQNPISKKKFAASLIFPFLAINTILLSAIFIFPAYVHYATILLAYHIGICAVDLMYIKSLFSSPKDALIEENENGYEILIKE
ncbi:DUF3267 domain-containing protein [Lederbergia citrea]|uniref:DUF3267 domain-containing protein n=1 Tax=Lederbergia citrea TaxID=2833581 RepID=A0A942Z189_9BACI|nr:DUF3267 domain-containing protein [Lederbergia citrea]MBS4177509.1 DUF3267 domain-containing protein [Lederbergia citrea]MBS4204182.1 DUF3267 domain-containing protein [Lederbergia citrea]MBS4221233.1 DUF3267 domain-containing protein [Lederbergia citrea]